MLPIVVVDVEFLSDEPTRLPLPLPFVEQDSWRASLSAVDASFWPSVDPERIMRRVQAKLARVGGAPFARLRAIVNAANFSFALAATLPLPRELKQVRFGRCNARSSRANALHLQEMLELDTFDRLLLLERTVDSMNDLLCNGCNTMIGSLNNCIAMTSVFF